MKFFESINSALYDLLETNKEVVLFGEDIVDPYGGAFKVTKGLSTNFPDRVISTPISEASLIGMAGGMAIGGINPIVEIMFGDFMGLGVDQLLNHLVKYEWMYNNKVRVPVTIRTAMGGRRGYGPTHSQSLEPLLASIPMLSIYSPSIYHNPGQMLKNIVTSSNSVSVFSENKLNYPKMLVNEENIKDGLSIMRSEINNGTVYLSNMDFEDPDVVIISHGGNALIIEDVLVELLMEYELCVQAILPSKIKPVDYIDIFKGIENCKCILTFEESPKDFGWGGEIISTFAEKGLCHEKIVGRIGADELPIPSALKLESRVLPSKSNIINFIKSAGII